MKVLKVRRLNLKPKGRPLATTLAVGPAVLPYGLILQGFGQLYNGQYLKAGGFFLNAVMGANILLESETSNTMTVIGEVGCRWVYMVNYRHFQWLLAGSVTNNYLTSGRSSFVTGEIPGDLLADTV